VDVEERKGLGIKAGDTVRVWQKIEEKGKTRLQAFEGTVLAVKHGTEPGATFTVRKVSLGVGVEKIFPLYSPNIDKIEIIKRARVRRAKLYFIRDKVSRELRRIFRKSQEVHIATRGAAELEEERKRAEEELKRQQEEEAKRAEEEAAAEAEDKEESTEALDEQDAAENKEDKSADEKSDTEELSSEGQEEVTKEDNEGDKKDKDDSTEEESSEEKDSDK
jgi:large subunit ribosomal protein L19